jgi:hypothetical protein
MKYVIALAGVKTSGKTTSFNYLKEFLPEIQEITLAKKLKDVAAAVTGVDRDSFDNQATKEKELETLVCLSADQVYAIYAGFGYGKDKIDYDKNVRPHIGQVLDTPRRIAQYVGTEILRSVESDIHCRQAVEGIPEQGVFVVTDMRFVNEFTYFKERLGDNFFPLYISNRVAELHVDSHPSEKQVLEVAKNCRKIDNNGSLQELRSQLEQFVGEIYGSLGKVASS